ncbi:hypothetical protein [Altericista sp. CCNU0014]|uniref:hypothetical protein n=1 Tax=Altericista sp. CCNU0014 TaxID=3082949 RepID=UPI0038517DAE
MTTIRLATIGVSLAAIAVAPFIGTNPSIARNLQNGAQQIAQNLPMLKPKVEMKLSVAKKVVAKQADGTSTTSWKELGDKPVVKPGDILRYSVSAQNSGQKAARNLSITQPIPPQATYISGSARNNGAALTFSIDGGKTFSAQPTIAVKLANGTQALRPAPASVYTNVRWSYTEALAPATAFRNSYEVAVK